MDSIGEDGNDSIRRISQRLFDRDCAHFLLGNFFRDYTHTPFSGDFIRFKTDFDPTSDSDLKWRFTVERCKNVIVPTCDLAKFEKFFILCLRDLGLSEMLDVLLIRE